MSEKITIQDITERLAEKYSTYGITKKECEIFVKGMFELIEEALAAEKYVKVKGLGTFKLTEVDSRESVNVNTGERIEIQGHTKISFTPDPGMRDLINKPFAHFETVILNENTRLEDTETEIEGEDMPADTPVPQTEVPSVEAVEEEKNTEEMNTEEMTGTQEETTGTQEETTIPKKTKTPWKLLVAIILIACIAGGIYWYLQSDNTPSPQPPVTVKAPQARADEVVPAIREAPDSLPQDTVKVAVATPGSKNVAKETLADTVEYDITGTKTSHTLQEGESLAKLAMKFYGTKKLWPYIVKHNKDIIKDADRVPVGTTLRIPELTPKK